MKHKDLTKKETIKFMLLGIGLLSFGLLLFWIPFIGALLQLSGILLIVVSFINSLKKMVK